MAPGSGRSNRNHSGCCSAAPATPATHPMPQQALRRTALECRPLDRTSRQEAPDTDRRSPRAGSSGRPPATLSDYLVNANDSPRPGMPEIRDLLFLNPVGVLSCRSTRGAGRIAKHRTGNPRQSCLCSLTPESVYSSVLSLRKGGATSSRCGRECPLGKRGWIDWSPFRQQTEAWTVMRPHARGRPGTGIRCRRSRAYRSPTRP